MSLIRILCVPFPDQYAVIPSLTVIVSFYQCTINRIDTLRANLKNHPAHAVIIRPRAGSKHRNRNQFVFWMILVSKRLFIHLTDFINFTLTCFLFSVMRSSVDI